MKIINLSETKTILKQVEKTVLKNIPTASDSTAGLSSAIHNCSIGQAQINIQKQFDKATGIISTLIKPEQKINRNYLNNGIRHIQIGEPIEGFKDLYNPTKHITCHYDESKTLKDICIQDINTNEVHIYNSNGELLKHFTKEDKEALKEYKYHPEAIHNILRRDRKTYTNSWQEEAEKQMAKLDEIFNNKTKVFKTDKNTVLYRGMQNDIPKEDMEKLKTIGAIYKDKSFVSTSTDLSVAKRFAGQNQVMEIEFPASSKYIDMDKLFNIDRTHWQESEFLLNRNSNFLITGYDSENNIIKAKYLNS